MSKQKDWLRTFPPPYIWGAWWIAAWNPITLAPEHSWNSSETIEYIAMSSSKIPLLIYRQMGQTRAVGSIPGRFRYTLSSRRPQSTLSVPTSRTTRRPFSCPYRLRTNLPSSIRNIFIQTESTPNVDVSQPNLLNMVVLISRLWNFSPTIQYYHQNYLQNFWSTYPHGRH